MSAGRGLAAGVALTAALAFLPGEARPSAPRPTLTLGACVTSATGRCGTLSRPENPAKVEGRQIGVHVLVLPALDARRRDGRTALFFLAGGPGGAASESLSWTAATFADYWQRHDLVFVDQRGTGRSNHLTCGEVRSVSFSSPAAAIRRAWSSCVRRLSSDPRFYTTSVAMDDLDAVRSALGYERIDLYGISYGATAAQIYLLRHGNRVRRVILDGGTLVGIPILERWARNGQRVLDRLFARCARDARCRAAFPDPAADLARVRSRLEQAPLRLGKVTVTPELLGNSVQGLTVRPETAVYVPLFLRLAAKGQFGELLRRSADLPGVGPPDQSLMAQVIMCSEPWARMRRSEVARLGRGTYLLETMLAIARYREAACGVLPKGVVPAGSATGPRSSAPLLAIVGAEDPQDPLENLSGIRSRLPNTTTVLVSGGGHGAAGIGCVPKLMNSFLLARSPGVVDARCAARAAPPPFVLR